MTAPVMNGDSEMGESTAGYLCCHFRRFGCDWSVVFRRFSDEPEALRMRVAHESVCSFHPYADLGGR